MTNVPKCPACGNELTLDMNDPLVYHFVEDHPEKGEKFPQKVQMVMSQNFYCEKCETDVSLTISRATYTNPKIDEIVE